MVIRVLGKRTRGDDESSYPFANMAHDHFDIAIRFVHPYKGTTDDYVKVWDLTPEETDMFSCNPDTRACYHCHKRFKKSSPSKRIYQFVQGNISLGDDILPNEDPIMLSLNYYAMDYAQILGLHSIKLGEIFPMLDQPTLKKHYPLRNVISTLQKPVEISFDQIEWHRPDIEYFTIRISKFRNEDETSTHLIECPTYSLDKLTKKFRDCIMFQRFILLKTALIHDKCPDTSLEHFKPFEDFMDIFIRTLH